MKTVSFRSGSCPNVSITPPRVGHFSLGVADHRDRTAIHQLRHNIYAEELAQHPVNPEGRLSDPVDGWNVYLVAKVDEEIAGFISITPPGHPSYSIDKYFDREVLPFQIDEHLYEVRLLTVLKAYRGSEAAIVLMYGALRWIEARAGKHVVAIGRREVLPLYTRTGLEPVGLSAQ